MLLPIQISFFKGHIQTKIEHSDSNHLYWWGGAGVQKNNKQTLENKEGLRVPALLLKISQYRENGEDSTQFIFARQQNKERLNNHTTK